MALSTSSSNPALGKNKAKPPPPPRRQWLPVEAGRRGCWSRVHRAHSRRQPGTPWLHSQHHAGELVCVALRRRFLASKRPAVCCSLLLRSHCCGWPGLTLEHAGLGKKKRRSAASSAPLSTGGPMANGLPNPTRCAPLSGHPCCLPVPDVLVEVSSYCSLPLAKQRRAASILSKAVTY